VSVIKPCEQRSETVRTQRSIGMIVDFARRVQADADLDS
jgi:hypothetical protein